MLTPLPLPRALSRVIARRQTARARRALRSLSLAMPLCALFWAGRASNVRAQAPSPASANNSPAVIAYVFPNLPGDRPLNATDVDPSHLTRINYAFALIQGGDVVESGPNDGANLRTLTVLRRGKPSLEVLISIGGWAGSGGFSDAALTPSSRRQFTASALTFVRKYDLDGVDIDWEYPGQEGAGNRFRPEDGSNFSLLLASLRSALDTYSRKVHRPMRLSIAAESTTQYLSHLDIAAVARSLDQVNLMAYDFYVPGETKPSRTGNHAALFPDPLDPQHASAADAVHAFEQAGVPASKLVLGVPFYGHAWTDVPPIGHGLFQTGLAAPDLHTGYPDIQALLTKGFTRYWDADAQVPYAYNQGTLQFISYEDPESLRRKAAFVRSEHLGGMMFWQYLSDPSGALLDALYRALQSTPSASAAATEHTAQP